jgi:SAM-dependent methyltransferase
MPTQRIIDQTVNLLSSLAGWPSLRILDLSCGEGQLLQALHPKGCRVEGTHYRQEDYIVRRPASILKDIPLHQNVDLTRPLPFNEEEFDVVIATEVMEHLPNHSFFLAEAARIIKPQGHLILTTPNIHSLPSRLQFFLTGQHELRGARLGWHVPAADLYTTHHNPVYFPVLHALFYHHHMRWIRTRFTTCNPAAFLLLPIVPLIWMATAIEMRHAIKRSRRGGLDALRWLCHFHNLFSDQFIVCAQKDESASGPSPAPEDDKA